MDTNLPVEQLHQNILISTLERVVSSALRSGLPTTVHFPRTLVRRLLPHWVVAVVLAAAAAAIVAAAVRREFIGGSLIVETGGAYCARHFHKSTRNFGLKTRRQRVALRYESRTRTRKRPFSEEHGREGAYPKAKNPDADLRLFVRRFITIMRGFRCFVCSATVPTAIYVVFRRFIGISSGL